MLIRGGPFDKASVIQKRCTYGPSTTVTCPPEGPFIFSRFNAPCFSAPSSSVLIQVLASIGSPAYYRTVRKDEALKVMRTLRSRKTIYSRRRNFGELQGGAWIVTTLVADLIPAVHSAFPGDTTGLVTYDEVCLLYVNLGNL